MDKTINDSIDINIKYTERDLRDFCFAKTYSRFGIIYIILYAVLLVPIIISMPLLLIFSFNTLKEYIPILILSFFPVIFLFLLSLGPFLSLYTRHKTNFQKSKLLHNLNCVEVSNDRFTVRSLESSFSLPWEEIYKIEELKPCFLIYYSPLKINIIPRRCFVSQEQLDEFRNILRNNVPKKKMKLKSYKLKKSLPDFGEVVTFDEITRTQENEWADESEKPEITLEYSLLKKDLLKINFKIYYTKPAGIILTLLGVFLLCRSLSVISDIGLYPVIFTLVLGMMFTIFAPIMLFVNTGRGFDKDPALQKPFILKIYNNYYTLEHPSGTSRIEWSKLVRVVELNSAFVFYISTQLYHMIPKSAIINNQESLLKLRNILNEKRKEGVKVKGLKQQ